LYILTRLAKKADTLQSTYLFFLVVFVVVFVLLPVLLAPVLFLVELLLAELFTVFLEADLAVVLFFAAPPFAFFTVFPFVSMTTHVF
jgi:hypothetical protein